MEGSVPILLAVGLLTIAALYFGRASRWLRLPSIIGFMIVGVILGPSGFNLIDSGLEERLAFIPQIALGFVALSIGMELRYSWLRKQGRGIILTIIGQCIGAFAIVAVLVYCAALILGRPHPLEGTAQYLTLALLMGAVATATAPAGTIAVIQECKARGPLTRALYAVVGYDDALAVIIYGFAIAVGRALLMAEAGETSPGFFLSLLRPLREVILGVLVGGAVGALFCLLARTLKRFSDMLILIVAFVLAVNGLSSYLGISFLLTTMAFGFVVGNSQPHSLIQRIRDDLDIVMPVFFILLFGLAGANLEISMLKHLGLLGILYILGRSAGKIGGARISASIGGLAPEIKNNLGPALLSQAGVAVGLALVAAHELRGIGAPASSAQQSALTSGDVIASAVVTTVTASCVLFEIVGPVLARIALTNAGETHGGASED